MTILLYNHWKETTLQKPQSCSLQNLERINSVLSCSYWDTCYSRSSKPIHIFNAYISSLCYSLFSHVAARSKSFLKYQCNHIALVVKYHPIAPHMLLFYNNNLSTVSTLMLSTTTSLQNQLSPIRMVSLLYFQCIHHFLFWGIYTCFHFSVCSFSIYPSNSGSHFQFLLRCHLCNEFCSDLLER